MLNNSAAMYIWYCIYSYGEWPYKATAFVIIPFCLYIHMAVL